MVVVLQLQWAPQKNQGEHKVTRALKKLHKWVGLLIGVQVFLWLLSGLVIALIDPVKVSGKQWARPTTDESQTFDSARLLDPAQLPAGRLENALGVDLMMHHGEAVYLVKRADGESLLNAIDGSPIVIDKADAANLAKRDFNGDGEIVSIEQGTAPGRETRSRQGAYWRVNFSDKANTAIYISASTGAIFERRNTYWRVRDFFWMLHIMDYPGRENFNNPLIITIALIAIWLGLSGFGLLFGSFTRADFYFLNIRRKHDSAVITLIDKKSGGSRQVKLRKGSNLFLSLATHNVNIASICGGGGECGKCRLKIAYADLPEANDIETRLIPKRLREQGYRLTCQQIVENDMALHLAESAYSNTQ